MAHESNRRTAISLVVCGLLLVPGAGAAAANTDTPTAGGTMVTLPVAGSARTSHVAVPIPDKSLHVTPSKLVTRRDLEFRRADAEWGPVRLTFLLYAPDVARGPAPVAVVSAFHVGDNEHVWIERIPPARSGARRPDIEIATIEHLYGLALAQNPHADFLLERFWAFVHDGEC